MKMSAKLAPGNLNQVSFVAFDTETTGLSPIAARLVELSAVRFRVTGEIIDTFSTLINPGIEIPAEATSVHGITDEMVEGEPPYSEAVPRFMEWLEEDNTVLIAHNAPFDLAFLEVCLARLGKDVPDYPVLDTLQMSRRFLTDAPSHQLSGLVEYLGLTGGSFHRALADSRHVAHVFRKIVETMGEIDTWETLTEMTNPLFFTDLVQECKDQTEALAPAFQPFHEAIESKTPIRIVYKGMNESSRVVTPNVMHSWRGNLYLNAYCHSAQSERTFRMDRIVNFDVLTSAAGES